MNNIKKTYANFESIDFVFSIIKVNKEISITDLMQKYSVELESYGIDQSVLEYLISKLEKDEVVLKDGNNKKYKINTLKSTFKGYFFQNQLEEEETQEKYIEETTLKKAPIYVAIFFGLSTTVLTALNYSLNLRNGSPSNKSSINLFIKGNKPIILNSHDSILVSIP